MCSESENTHMASHVQVHYSLKYNMRVKPFSKAAI